MNETANIVAIFAKILRRMPCRREGSIREVGFGCCLVQLPLPADLNTFRDQRRQPNPCTSRLFPAMMARALPAERMCRDRYDVDPQRSRVVHCNCAWGCPCQFNSLPTHGNCQAVAAVDIEEGLHGETQLSGLRIAMIVAWPGPIHEGRGQVIPIVDERADEKQRDALLRIMSSLRAITRAAQRAQA